MPDTETPVPSDTRRPFLGLSIAQLVGGSAAAATAAVLGARLGTTGTIIGAALVSLVSAVASAFYTASLRRTREVVAKTRELIPATMTWRTGQQDLPEVAQEVAEEKVEEATPSVWSRIGWKSVAVAAGSFFLITALLVTGFELVSGKSIEGGGRTTVSNAFDGGTPASSTPTPTPASTPSPKVSTGQTTSTSASPTASPTTSSSATPTESASPTATTSSTPTASPSATADSSPSASPTQ